MTKQEQSRIHVFVSYSRKDQRWLDRLRIHLVPLARDYDVDLWDDTRIRPGSRWREEIRVAVERANVAILLISADFLASEFIRTNELPPLLKAAEEEGALILPIIVSPSLFLKTPDLSQFQAVNSPATSLVSAPEGDQEAIFVRVADSILERATSLRSSKAPTSAPERKGHAENFSDHGTWTRLIKIGDWILDEQQKRIIGAGIRAYLLSREEYGRTLFSIQAQLEFTNFRKPAPKQLGMNAGIVFGWKIEREVVRYYNVLLTGSELLVERIGFNGGSESQDFEHITPAVSLSIEPAKAYKFELQISDRVQIKVNGKLVQSLERSTGVVGRVGLRPWRSKLDCTNFFVSSQAL